jgi:hypothetical protein
VWCNFPERIFSLRPIAKRRHPLVASRCLTSCVRTLDEHFPATDDWREAFAPTLLTDDDRLSARVYGAHDRVHVAA